MASAHAVGCAAGSDVECVALASAHLEGGDMTNLVQVNVLKERHHGMMSIDSSGEANNEDTVDSSEAAEDDEFSEFGVDSIGIVTDDDSASRDPVQ